MMAREKGTPKTGGRKKGTQNKVSQEKLSTIQELCVQYNCDPFESLLKIASDPMTVIDLKVNILKELCQYIYPKRKSIEVIGELINEPQIMILLPDNDRNSCAT